MTSIDYTVNIRPLTTSHMDCESYLNLRREMLLDAPWAFGSSPEDSRFKTVSDLQEEFSNEYILTFGAFVRLNNSDVDSLIGALSIVFTKKVKSKHLCNFYGMFVQKKFRNQKIGKTLLLNAIDYLKLHHPEVSLVLISASSGAPAAIRLYKNVGFQQFGVEPAVLYVNGEYFDEHCMSLFVQPLKGNRVCIENSSVATSLTVFTVGIMLGCIATHWMMKNKQ